MDIELSRELSQRLSDIQKGANISVTPQAIALMVVLIDSIQDDQAERLLNRVDLKGVQRTSIERVPSYLETISRLYNTERIDALMLLNVMPRFMSGFCPPFENPP